MTSQFGVVEAQSSPRGMRVILPGIGFDRTSIALEPPVGNILDCHTPWLFLYVILPVVIWFAEKFYERGDNLDHWPCGAYHDANVEHDWRRMVAHSIRLLTTCWTADWLCSGRSEASVCSISSTPSPNTRSDLGEARPTKAMDCIECCHLRSRLLLSPNLPECSVYWLDSHSPGSQRPRVLAFGQQPIHQHTLDW